MQYIKLKFQFFRSKYISKFSAKISIYCLNSSLNFKRQLHVEIYMFLENQGLNFPIKIQNLPSNEPLFQLIIT